MQKNIVKSEYNHIHVPLFVDTSGKSTAEETDDTVSTSIDLGK